MFGVPLSVNVRRTGKALPNSILSAMKQIRETGTNIEALKSILSSVQLFVHLVLLYGSECVLAYLKEVGTLFFFSHMHRSRDKRTFQKSRVKSKSGFAESSE